MNRDSSRRNFLAAGLALPAAGLASATGVPSPSPAPPQAQPATGELTYRTLGKTGLKVTTVGYGCMITSDPDRDYPRGRYGHHVLRYIPPLPGRTKRAHGGSGPGR